MKKWIHHLIIMFVHRSRKGRLLPFFVPMVNVICGTTYEPRHVISVDDQDLQVMMDRYVASLKLTLQRMF